MNALIFGANGQDGHYLNLACQQRGLETIGTSRTGNWIHADVSCYAHTEELIRKYKPTYLFHLAANSLLRHETIFENHAAISTGTLNILESVYRHSPTSKVFICGSGVQFENRGQPIDEKSPFVANDAYAVMRIQSVYTARYYRTLGIRTYVGYFFHHESPLRRAHFVSQKIALAAKRIAVGLDKEVLIGNSTIEKEWTFAGDIAEAIMVLMEQETIFEAVIGSGQTHTVQEWIELCFDIVKLDWRLYVKQDEKFRSGYSRLVSNPARIFSLGWQPKVTFRELAEMMVSSNDVGK